MRRHSRPVLIFLSPPVVLPSFISRFALVRQQIDSDTTGLLKKNWSRTEPKISWLLKKITQWLDQIFFCDSIILERICYGTRAKRLMIESNTTGRMRKIWTGNEYLMPFKWLGCSRKKENAIMCIYFYADILASQITYWSSPSPNFFPPSSCIALIYQSFCSCTVADRLQYDWMAEKSLDGS